MRFNLQQEYIEVCDQVHRLAQMLKERDAEIERLKAQIETERRHYAEDSRDLLELTALLTRAADALEFWMKDLASTEQQYVDAAMRDERLLAELRKAAE
jgi:chromosome segregation ATPase